MGSAYDISRRRVTPRSLAVNLGLVLGIAVAGFMWVRIANLVTQNEPVAAPLSQQPVSIVWGDHVFSSRATLAAWLRARHIDVTLWLRQHPDAASIIGGQPASAEATGGVAKRSAVPEKKAPPAEARPRSGSRLGALGLDLLVGAALVLGAFAIAPRSAWRRALPRLHGNVEQRIYAAAGAAGILFGLVVGGIFP
jgi:hypothetical protein